MKNHHQFANCVRKVCGVAVVDRLSTCENLE